MIQKIHPASIHGTVAAPPSKSYAQRALAAALLSKETSIIRNPSRCNDALAALQVIQDLGARVNDQGTHVIIEGGLNPQSALLNFGEAGLGIRLFSSIVALHHSKITLSGEGSLLKRPMGSIQEALIGFGAHCETTSGFLPIRIQGPLTGGSMEVDGSLSSQVLTGLLMALPLAQEDSILRVRNLKSIPYIDMTLEVMRKFQISISHTHYEEFHIPGAQVYVNPDFTIEGDWSGAAFLLVAGALAGQVTVTHLRADSVQADQQILTALRQAGAQLDIQEHHILCAKADLRSFSMDATHCPDLFPPLVALAAHCQGESRIRGVSRLIHKESNRAEALLREMGNLGVRIRIQDDEMIILGPTHLESVVVDSHNDHRIAMAAAVVALPGSRSIEIEGAECIHKSYPEFYQDLKKLGEAAYE